MIAPMNNPLMMLVQTMRGGGDPMQLLQKNGGAKSTSGSSNVYLSTLVRKREWFCLTSTREVINHLLLYLTSEGKKI